MDNQESALQLIYGIRIMITVILIFIVSHGIYSYFKNK
jgi:hypothetical protein